MEEEKDGLIFRTNPDHQILEFTPGTGITAYVYSHHGTLAGVDVKLVSFASAQRKH